MKIHGTPVSRFFGFPQSLATLFMACGALNGLNAAVYTWDPTAGNGAVDSGGGTWATTGSLWTTNGGSTNVAWVDGNGAIFSGADTGGTIVLSGNRTIAGTGNFLSFQNSGYTLQSDGGTVRTITFSNSTELLVASGKTLTIGSNVNITGAIVGGATAASSGTIDINSGGKISGSSTNTLSFRGDGTLINLKAGGSITAAASIIVGGGTGENVTMVISGGSLTTTAGSGNFSLINGSSSTAASSTVTIDSGDITLGGTSTSSKLLLGSASGATPGTTTTFNLNGGTVSVGSVAEAGGLTTTSNFNFNGGILKTGSVNVALTGVGTFMGGLNNVNVKAGGAKIDTSNGVTANNITISSALAHDAGLGATADGGLEKLGAGTLTLTGANTYTGATVVTAGGLATAATGTFGNGNIDIGAGASLTLGNGTSIADTATLLFTSTSSVGLSFVGTETVGGIQLQSGGLIGEGIYSADDLNTFFGGTVFSGAGFLQVSAIPEPSTWAVLLGTVALTGTVGWRRRR